MKRREFLRIGAGSAGWFAAATNPLLAACSSGAAEPLAPGALTPGDLYRPVKVAPDGLTLVARRATAEVAPGVRSPIMTYGDGPVGPTIEARSGDRARIELRNELDEPTIVHWHGLRPPEAADGHPRLAIGPGEVYRYDFEIAERPGLYWYHSHAHMRTAPQVYQGLAGLLVVRDDRELALELPDGSRELTIVIQDKRQDASGRVVYDPIGHEMMEGFLGDVPFVNGTSAPRVEVESALYRLRVLAAANARIYRLSLSNGSPLTMIGSEGGLLDAPVELPYIDLGTGERTDLLVDFSGIPAGTTVKLRSLEFTVPGGMGMGMMGRGMMGRGRGMMGMAGSSLPQGAALDLMEFVVTGEVREDRRIPAALDTVPRFDRSGVDRTRTFRFDSMMMNHTINGRSFDVDRVDERVPFGATEVWRFVNDAPFAHPVHMHAVHFEVLSRTGGRGRVMPWENGLKDTVLVFPGETVEVITRFDSHRGLFLMHCHNLEHEDMGMMMNFLID